MQYTKYMGLKVLESGTPHFKKDVFIKIVKIISIEGSLAGLRLAKKNMPEHERYKFDMLIFKKGKELTEITKNLPPDELLEKMIKEEAY